jgi:hypothetical protein
VTDQRSPQSTPAPGDPLASDEPSGEQTWPPVPAAPGQPAAPGPTDPIAPVDGAAATLLTAESSTAAASAGSTTRPSRRAAIAGGLTVVARPTAVIALFVLGIAIGVSAFQATRPARPLADTAGAQITTQEVPPAVQSLVAAMRVDDRKMMATIVPATPYSYLTGELTSWNISSILGVEVLGSYSTSAFTETELVLVSKTSTGSTRATNLIVELQNGVISGFR